MTLDAAAQKGELRRQVRAELKALTAESRRQASLAAYELLRREAIWREATSILFYSPLPGEIDLLPLLAEALADGQTVALPGFVAESGAYDAFVIRHLLDDCAPGKFGIAEPKPTCARMPLSQLDLVLVPGVAFDLTGHRLGRGQGFYDRLLANVAGPKCGVAFDFQVVERIPAEAHDVRMDYLLTPTCWRQLPA